ncbi:MAG: hypothetical protein U1E47_08065 [Rivihabitans pingtungensis]
MTLLFALSTACWTRRAGGDQHPGRRPLHPSQINVNAGQYQSPYTLAFDFDWATLTHGLEKPPFAHWREQGREPAFARGPHDWFAPSAYARAHAHPAHGPLPRHYPPSRPPAGVERHRHDAWRAQRLLAVAAAMVGYGWRQHLTPDWNPDAAWFARFGLPADPARCERRRLWACCTTTRWAFSWSWMSPRKAAPAMCTRQPSAG